MATHSLTISRDMNKLKPQDDLSKRLLKAGLTIKIVGGKYNPIIIIQQNDNKDIVQNEEIKGEDGAGHRNHKTQRSSSVSKTKKRDIRKRRKKV